MYILYILKSYMSTVKVLHRLLICTTSHLIPSFVFLMLFFFYTFIMFIVRLFKYLFNVKKKKMLVT